MNMIYRKRTILLKIFVIELVFIHTTNVKFYTELNIAYLGGVKNEHDI